MASSRATRTTPRAGGLPSSTTAPGASSSGPGSSTAPESECAPIVEAVAAHQVQAQVDAGGDPGGGQHVAVIHNALYGVTQEGTSARSFVNAPYKSGGKTEKLDHLSDAEIKRLRRERDEKPIVLASFGGHGLTVPYAAIARRSASA